MKPLAEGKSVKEIATGFHNKAQLVQLRDPEKDLPAPGTGSYGIKLRRQIHACCA
jgi:hypothetical protein